VASKDFANAIADPTRDGKVRRTVAPQWVHFLSLFVEVHIPQLPHLGISDDDSERGRWIYLDKLERGGRCTVCRVVVG
jgi:hypothetical protein